MLTVKPSANPQGDRISVNSSTSALIDRKKCKGCNKILSVSAFGIKRPASNGLAKYEPKCKSCDSKRRKIKYNKKKKESKQMKANLKVIDPYFLEISDRSTQNEIKSEILNQSFFGLILENLK